MKKIISFVEYFEKQCFRKDLQEATWMVEKGNVNIWRIGKYNKIKIKQKKLIYEQRKKG